MSTIDDMASDREQQFLDAARAHRRQDGPTPCGACHNCSEALVPGRRFCDAECRDDWGKRTGR